MARAGDAPPQDVRFCRSADGTRIAYAVHGSGPPLLLAACWLSHLELNAQVAQALALSVRTVERHLTSIYAKLGLTGRAARAAAVARLLAAG